VWAAWRERAKLGSTITSRVAMMTTITMISRRVKPREQRDLGESKDLME
jgi:hypothetical protein